MTDWRSVQTCPAFAPATHQRSRATADVVVGEQRVWLSALDSGLRAIIIVTPLSTSARRCAPKITMPVWGGALQEAGKRNDGDTVAPRYQGALGVGSTPFPSAVVIPCLPLGILQSIRPTARLDDQQRSGRARALRVATHRLHLISKWQRRISVAVLQPRFGHRFLCATG
jgi:hypothetical protein